MEQHYFNQFSRVNEAIHPESLKADELVTLENMRLDDQIAAAVSRKGFDRYNQQVNSSGVITSLFDVEDENGNNYLLAQIGTVFRKSLNGSEAYSTIKTGLTNAKLRMAVYGENFFFTNNNEPPFVVNGDLATVNNIEITRPDIEGVDITENNATDATLISHRYVITFVTSDNQESNPSKPIYYSVLADTDQIDMVLTSLPVSTDTRVVSKRIYRTKVNDYTNYYLLATIDNSQTSYNDVSADDMLDLTESPVFVNTPDLAKYITTNNERLFFGYPTKTIENVVSEPFFFPPSINNLLQDDTQAGNLSAGVYKWGVTLIDKNDNESALTEYFTNTQGGSTRADFFIANFPLIKFEGLVEAPESYTNPNTWVFDKSLKTIRIYRTKVDGSTYYKLVDISPEEILSDYFGVAYQDSAADASLTQEYPVNEKNATNQNVLPSTIIYSELFEPNTFPELNLVQIFPDDNDPITGIFNDDNGIMVFKERSICKLYTNGDPTNWQITKLVEDVGCDKENSIYKYGEVYYFFYKKRPYVFDGRSAINIGESRRNTFDSVTAINGATFWHDSQFYIMAVEIGTNYYLLCYDTKLQGWYKWSVSKASDIITKRFGADKDKILLGRNTYVTHYNEDIDYDNDSGARADINVQLKTKDYRVDGFVNQRLWMLYLDYRKRLNRITDNIIFRLTDPDKPASTLTYNDNSSTVVRNKFKIPTDAMIGTMKRARVINLSFSGVSMDQFINGRLDYMPEVWGVERRDPGDISGLGVSHGSEAGVSD